MHNKFKFCLEFDKLIQILISVHRKKQLSFMISINLCQEIRPKDHKPERFQDKQTVLSSKFVPK